MAQSKASIKQEPKSKVPVPALSSAVSVVGVRCGDDSPVPEGDRAGQSGEGSTQGECTGITMWSKIDVVHRFTGGPQGCDTGIFSGM